MRDLLGRRALVTGGSRGIGKGIALALASAGADVAILSRTEAASEEVAIACRKKKVRAFAVAADVTKQKMLAAAMTAGVTQLGGLDILVTSAGVAWLGPIGYMPEDMWRSTIEINLIGSMEAVRYALPSLRASPAATIILIGSVSSKISYSGGAGYCASKHGLLGFAESLYEEVKAQRIKVSAVCPGTVDTDMTMGSGYPFDPSQILAVDDVVEAAMYVVRTSPRTCPTEIVLRCHHPTIV